MSDDFIGQKFNDGNLTVVDVSEKKRGRIKLYSVVCSICSKDPELFGNGVFESTKSDLLRGSLPCGCSNRFNNTNEQFRIRLNRISNGRYDIVTADEIVKQKQIISVKCVKHDLVWQSSVSWLLRGSGCPKCKHEYTSNSNRLCDDTVNTKIHERCSEIDVELLKIHGCYQNNKTLLGLSCHCGQTWTCSYKSFVSQRSGCPKCSDHGYNIGKPGTFYITSWKMDSLTFLKYGITNHFKRRLKQHATQTNATLVKQIAFHFESGIIAKQIESDVDSSVFCNHTETLPESAYDDIIKIVERYQSK